MRAIQDILNFAFPSSLNPSQEEMLRKRRIKHAARSAFQNTLGTVGYFLPRTLKTNLAKHSTRLGYLLLGEGDFVYSEYRGDLYFLVNAKFNVERAVMTGEYESELLSVIDQVVQRDDICIDVGANTGAISLALCQKVETNGRVLSLEPGPPFFERMKKNIALNPSLKKQWSGFNLGLSDKAGTLNWLEDDLFPGNAGLLEKDGTPVPVITLDELITKEKLPRVDFIKIDVEGMELEVLKGATETLKQHRPLIAFETAMEFEAIRRIPIRKQTEMLLSNYDYQLYSIEKGWPLQEIAYPNFTANTLAIPKGHAILRQLPIQSN